MTGSASITAMIKMHASVNFIVHLLRISEHLNRIANYLGRVRMRSVAAYRFDVVVSWRYLGGEANRLTNLLDGALDLF